MGLRRRLDHSTSSALEMEHYDCQAHIVNRRT